MRRRRELHPKILQCTRTAKLGGSYKQLAELAEVDGAWLPKKLRHQDGFCQFLSLKTSNKRGRNHQLPQVSWIGAMEFSTPNCLWISVVLRKKDACGWHLNVGCSAHHSYQKITIHRSPPKDHHPKEFRSILLREFEHI